MLRLKKHSGVHVAQFVDTASAVQSKLHTPAELKDLIGSELILK